MIPLPISSIFFLKSVFKAATAFASFSDIVSSFVAATAIGLDFFCLPAPFYPSDLSSWALAESPTLWRIHVVPLGRTVILLLLPPTLANMILYSGSEFDGKLK